MPFIDKEDMANGNSLSIRGYSPTSVTSLSHTDFILLMKSVLHTLLVSHNLISVHKLCLDNDAIVEFHATHLFTKEA